MTFSSVFELLIVLVECGGCFTVLVIYIAVEFHTIKNVLRIVSMLDKTQPSEQADKPESGGSATGA